VALDFFLSLPHLLEALIKVLNKFLIHAASVASQGYAA
jgi:hypothetical protein